MTGYTVHTGSSEKFSSGWDQIFAGKKAASKTAKAPAAAASNEKKAATSGKATKKKG